MYYTSRFEKSTQYILLPICALRSSRGYARGFMLLSHQFKSWLVLLLNKWQKSTDSFMAKHLVNHWDMRL